MWDVDTMSVIKNVGYEIYVQPYAGSTMLASGHETTATLLKEALILMVQ